MPLRFEEADAEKMRAVQQEIAIVLRRARDERVEAGLVIFALVRCARTLLDQYPTETRRMLLDVIAPFLAGGTPVDGSLLMQ